MSDILIQQNNEALVPPEFPTNVREQAPVLIQENILQDGGIAATVDVASTTTLDPDTPAYVNNIGDEKHAILQFGIPKGETGAAGVDGVDGQAATITVGSTTTVDPDESAAVVNSGTSQNAVLNFSIPQGVQGEQGEQGISPRAYVEQTATGAMIHIDDYMTETNVEVLNGQDGADGQAATVSVGSTTTGAAGTNASVVNSGTTSAAVLDFTIPRGADGAAGSDGSDGFSPIATVSQTASGATISITDAQGTTTANITNGVDGTDGTDGITPSITATASVDNTTGTPSVSVSKTGTDANPNFDFAFEHLKGETPSFSYATVFTDDYYLTNGVYVVVPLNPNKSTNDNGKSIISGNLSYDSTNNCIVVGSGISAVEVSGEFSIEGGNVGSNVWGVISLNNTDASYRITSTSSYTTGYLTQYNFAPAIVSVNQGDKIRLLAYTSGNNIKIRGATAQSYITIKQVS